MLFFREHNPSLNWTHRLIPSRKLLVIRTLNHLLSYVVFKHFLSFILWLDNDVSQTWKRCQILFIYFYKILYIFRRLFQVSFILKVILYFKYLGYAPLSSVNYYFIVARFLQVSDQCRDGGPISPSKCTYMRDWLAELWRSSFVDFIFKRDK